MKTFLPKLGAVLLGGPLRRLLPRRFLNLLRWLLDTYLDRGRWAAGPESPQADLRALFAVETALRPAAAPPPDSAELPAHLAAFLKRAIAPQATVLCADCPADVPRLITLATGAAAQAITAPEGRAGVVVLGGHMAALPEALGTLAAWGESSGAAVLLLYAPRYEADRARVLLHDPGAFQAAARAAGLHLLDQAFTWDAMWSAFAPEPGHNLPHDSGGGTIGEMI